MRLKLLKNVDTEQQVVGQKGDAHHLQVLPFQGKNVWYYDNI